MRKFLRYFWKKTKNYNQYIKATKDIIKECKRLNIVNRDDFDTFQINYRSFNKLLFELKMGYCENMILRAAIDVRMLVLNLIIWNL